MKNTVTERLLAVLEQLGYKTQQDIGVLLGVSRGAAGTYVRGAQSPSIESLEAVFKKHPEINSEYVLKAIGNPFVTGETVPRSLAKPDAAPSTQSNVSAEPADKLVMPEQVERKTLAPGDAPGHLKIVRLTYEELLAENADLHRQLKVSTGQVVDMLTEEVKRLRKPLTSSEAADLRKTVDQIACEKSDALYVAPGFKQAVHRRLA